MESKIRLVLAITFAILACGCSQAASVDAAASKAVQDRFPGSAVDRTFPAALKGKPVVCVQVDGGMMVVADGKALMRDELDNTPLAGTYEACAEQPQAKAARDAT